MGRGPAGSHAMIDGSSYARTGHNNGAPDDDGRRHRPRTDQVELPPSVRPAAPRRGPWHPELNRGSPDTIGRYETGGDDETDEVTYSLGGRPVGSQANVDNYPHDLTSPASLPPMATAAPPSPVRPGRAATARPPCHAAAGSLTPGAPGAARPLAPIVGEETAGRPTRSGDARRAAILRDAFCDGRRSG